MKLSDAACRYLRRIIIHHADQMFAGNYNCLRELLDAGCIEVVRREGQWRKLRPTARGLWIGRVK